MVPLHGKVTQQSKQSRGSPGLAVINVDHVGWDHGDLSAQCGGCIPDSGRRPSEGQAERYFHVLTKAVGMRE